MNYRSRNKGEGEKKNDFVIHAQVKGKFAFFIVGPGQAQGDGKAMGAFANFEENYILLQDQAQKAIGQSHMQSLVVMQEAGDTIGHRQALNQVVFGEIFEGEAGAAENKLSVGWNPEEEAKKPAMRSDVSKTAPQYPHQQGRQPDLYLRGENSQFLHGHTAGNDDVMFVVGRATGCPDHFAVDLIGSVCLRERHCA
jgi:hypothetical protein